tara:strand:+ start:1482 stop:1859 length:378 start_codon:yes stop_codon:yes gene_type:complete
MSTNKKTIPTRHQVIDRSLQQKQVDKADVALGQEGCVFVETTGAVTPPTGKVFVAISFLADAKLSALVAESTKFLSTSAGGDGGGTDALTADNVFPKGFTLYGRFTSFTPNDALGSSGIVAYVGD